MKQKRFFLLGLGFMLVAIGCNQPQPGNGKLLTQQRRLPSQPVFLVQQPNYQQSPFTGITRRHWADAGLYLLQGAFSYVSHLNDPLYFPKQDGKSYPRRASQSATEKLEGLCRTLFIAAPLLRTDSTLTVHNISLATYYRHQLQQLLVPQSSTYIPPCNKTKAPSQNLVEFGGLALCFFMLPEVLWQPLPPATKKALAARMLSYATGPTIASNWEFFNVLILSFLDQAGYAVDKRALAKHLANLSAHYRGDGWYEDNPAFDYYSLWAYQMYGLLWSHYYGDRHFPAQAAQFRQRFAPVKMVYPYLFGRQGTQIMWGRSISYRFAATIPLALTGLEGAPHTNYGWMRRIASGALLQFLQHPQFLQDNIPTLGFYGAFEPAVQNYSCRGSVFWMGKAFLSLLLPETNPYWSATENEGPWAESHGGNGVTNHFYDTAALLLTNYAGIGAAEVRAWCYTPVAGKKNEYRASENYNRLSYNSAFPWQADNVPGVVAMNYLFKTPNSNWQPLQLFTFKRYDSGIFYRDAVLETNKNIRINLAEMPLPNGILRIDRNQSTEAALVHLGHYALPQLANPIKKETRTIGGRTIALIDNGLYQLAMVPLQGWQQVTAIDTKGVHPQSSTSAVLNVASAFVPNAQTPAIYATVMLWKKSGTPFTASELAPIQKVTPAADGSTVTVQFRNGTQRQFRF